MGLARQLPITEGSVLEGAGGGVGECQGRVSDLVETALSCTINR